MSESDSGELADPSGEAPEVLNGELLREEVRGVAQEVVQEVLEVQTFHAGPLPDSVSFASYEQTLAGTADRIVTMTETEQRERHHRQRVGLYAGIAIRILGMLFALGFALVAILIGADLIREGEDVAVLVFMLGGLSPIIAAFLFRRTLPSPPAAPGE